MSFCNPSVVKQNTFYFIKVETNFINKQWLRNKYNILEQKFSNLKHIFEDVNSLNYSKPNTNTEGQIEDRVPNNKVTYYGKNKVKQLSNNRNKMPEKIQKTTKMTEKIKRTLMVTPISREMRTL